MRGFSIAFFALYYFGLAVFSGRMEAAPSVWCAGLVQTWLDLGVAGERGSEAAEHLLQENRLPA